MGPGDRVGTFCWNNQAHLEAYLAVPSMGAVLHTLNIRLFPEQLAYVIDHAEDKVIIVDASLDPAAGPGLRRPQVGRDGDRGRRGRHRGAGRDPLLRGRCSAAEEPGYDWPELDERDAAAMCYTSGHHRQPQGRRLQPPLDGAALRWPRPRPPRIGMTEADRLLGHRAHVPRQRLGHALCRLHGRHRPGHAPDVPPGRAPGPDHRRAAADPGLRGAHHLERPAAGGRPTRTSTSPRCATSPPGARPCPAP